MTHTRSKIFLFLLVLLMAASMAGCKKPEPARLMVQIEGELFSDAILSIDGKQVGKLTKTLIKTDGRLFIDDVYTVTLPPDHKDIPAEDQCTGALDSLEMKAGKYTILLRTENGQTVQVNATLVSGLNLIVYDVEGQMLRLNDSKTNAAPGSTVTLP